MPVIRSFRALRFAAEAIGDLALVVSPPYDVIGPDEHRRLLARHPNNVVRLDLPAEEPGDEPDERYRRAARTLAAWRSDGVLRKDVRPTVYAYEQVYRVPGTGVERTQRGFFGRLRLEPLTRGSGVRAHERTLEGPREDRYRLLRATGVNTSPVVGLYGDPSGRAAAVLAAAAVGAADVDVVDDDGVRHRLWLLTDSGDPDAAGTILTDAAGQGPVTIADGHHRYETALRYRDERRMSRSCEEDPAFDYLLMLFLDAAAEPVTVLPTHRVVHDLGDRGVDDVRRRLTELFDVDEQADAAGLVAEFERAALAPGGGGRFGLLTRGGAYRLRARADSFAPLLPAGGAAVRALDVTLLGIALERLCGIDAEALAHGQRVSYTKSATDAAERVATARDGADAAFLLEPTSAAAIAAVAAEGDVMPQKSTYLYPKPLTGLVINPHEW